MPNLVKTAHAAGGDGLSIHLAPDIVGEVFGVPITSTLLTVWLTMVVLIGLAFFLRRRLAHSPDKTQTAVELLVGEVFNYMTQVLENRNLARRYFPLVMTIFIFVLSMNWIGLLPGVDAIGIYKETHSHGEVVNKLVPFFHPPATDLNITIAFAIVAFVAIEVAGVLAIGTWKYLGKFINFKGKSVGQRVLNFIIGIIELMSELARLVAFSFRLFGNIFAGKTMLLVVMFLATPYLLPVPLIAYEMFVGFIQAFIFAILTLFFIKLAVTEPH